MSNVLRGGQVTAHRFRMTFQVLRIMIRVALCVMLFTVFMTFKNNLTRHEWVSAPTLIAKLIDNWSPKTQKYANDFRREVLQPQTQKIIQEIATGKSSVGSKYSSTKLEQPTQMPESLNSKSPVEVITKHGRGQVNPPKNKHLKDEKYVDNRIDKANAKIEKTRVENLNNQKKMQHKADKQLCFLKI